MNAKKAKALRNAAKSVSGYYAEDRELVRKKNGVILNKEGTVRSMYLKLKKTFNKPKMKGLRSIP